MQPLTPNIFEKQVLGYAHSMVIFCCVFVPTISGFNIYCLVSGKFVSAAMLTILLAGYLTVLLILRHPVTDNTKIAILRYGFRTQLFVFAAYLVYVIGIEYRLESTPWTFLCIFMISVLMPGKSGSIMSMVFILLMLFFMIGSDFVRFKENFDVLIRFYTSLILFSGLYIYSVHLRSLYLKNFEIAQLRLQDSEQAARELSRKLMAEINLRDRIEKQLHNAIKMEAIGNLAAGVAHDLNNILSGIVTYPDLLLLDMKKNDPMRKSVETIRTSGLKAAAIVEDLLAMARRSVSNPEILDLKTVVETYLASPELGKLLADNPGMNIKTCYEPDILNIKGSPVHLSKAVMNLISNAAEAMPDGGDIFIHIYSQFVENMAPGPHDLPEGKYTVLSITDTGIGIPEQDIEKIFEPFYTKKKMGRSGTGLGMAVVLGTVKDHHAFIDVKSRMGKGTTFTLFFPVTLDRLEEKAPGETVDTLFGNNEKILVVDDLPEQRRIATQILCRLGYDAVSCSSGEEALLVLEKHSFDLLIIDMIMAPGMDGVETYQKILKFNPSQKAIFATGFSDTQKTEAARGLGTGSLLSKPYSLEGMGRRIKKELGKQT